LESALKPLSVDEKGRGDYKAPRLNRLRFQTIFRELFIDLNHQLTGSIQVRLAAAFVAFSQFD
jgi:hypothetical protein